MHFEAFSIFCSLSKGLILARIQADACWGTPDWLGRALARHPVHLWRDHVWWSHHRSVGSPCVQHLFVDLGYAWAVIQHELGTWLQVTRCIQNGVQLIPEAAWFEIDSDLHRSCFAQERKGETWCATFIHFLNAPKLHVLRRHWAFFHVFGEKCLHVCGGWCLCHFVPRFIEERFPPEMPQLFGLHPNAEIGFLTSQGINIFKTVQRLGPSFWGMWRLEL